MPAGVTGPKFFPGRDPPRFPTGTGWEAGRTFVDLAGSAQEEMDSTGALSGETPIDPKNWASPKANTPPSAAASQ